MYKLTCRCTSTDQTGKQIPKGSNSCKSSKANCTSTWSIEKKTYSGYKVSDQTFFELKCSNIFIDHVDTNFKCSINLIRY